MEGLSDGCKVMEEDNSTMRWKYARPVTRSPCCRQKGASEGVTGYVHPLQCFLPLLPMSWSLKSDTPSHSYLYLVRHQTLCIRSDPDLWHPASSRCHITAFVSLAAFCSDTCKSLHMGVPAFGIIPLKSSSSKSSNFQ